MDDMTMLRQFGVALDADLPELPASLRAQCLSKIVAPSGFATLSPTAGTPGPRRTKSWSSRPVRGRLGGRRRVVLIGMVAATVAAALTVAPVSSWFGGHAGAEPAEAATVMHRAAQAALAAPDPQIRGNEFIYVESVVSYLNISVGAGGAGAQKEKATIEPRKDRRIWLSVDGTQAGTLAERSTSGTWSRVPLDGCAAGMSAPQTKGGQSVPGQPCTPVPNFHPELPTTVGAMKAWLYANSQGGNSPDEQAWITVGDTIREAYIPVKARAAMFEAAAKIPGVYVVPQVTDVLGRAGVAVARDSGGSRSELIFDASTYVFLGERDVAVKPMLGFAPGAVIGYRAVTKVAIVPEAGQLP